LPFPPPRLYITLSPLGQETSSPPCVRSGPTLCRSSLGVTGLLLLTESHLACDTFPERGFASFNLYCCRPLRGVP